MDANQQQDVLMLTTSCVAEVDVLINGQAFSTQAQRSALTHFAICPLLVLLLLLLIPSITSLRALAELSSRCFQVPTLMPFPIRVHNFLCDGVIFTQLCFGFHDPNFDMEQPPIATRESYHNTTVCRSTQKDRGRVSTS